MTQPYWDHDPWWWNDVSQEDDNDEFGPLDDQHGGDA